MTKHKQFVVMNVDEWALFGEAINRLHRITTKTLRLYEAIPVSTLSENDNGKEESKEEIEDPKDANLKKAVARAKAREAQKERQAHEAAGPAGAVEPYGGHY